MSAVVIDLARLREARGQAEAVARARIEGRTPAGPQLPPYHGEEGPSAEFVTALQRRTIKEWIARHGEAAAARREIAARRKEAIAEAEAAEADDEEAA